MQLAESDVAQIVNEVFSAMLGFEVVPAYDGKDVGKSGVAGSIVISGSTDCMVTLEMPPEGAALYAATMFQMDATDLADDEITDAVGELVNMVGGNVKNLFPDPCSLSLPIVARGDFPAMRVVGGKKLMHSSFVCEAHPIDVTIWNKPSP